MKLTSDFAIVSIKHDRAKLAKHFEPRTGKLGPCPENLRVPITITGYIDGIWGGNDGIDQEFTVSVTHLDLTQTPPSQGKLEWEERHEVHSALSPLGLYQVWEADTNKVYLRLPNQGAGRLTGTNIPDVKVVAEKHFADTVRSLVDFGRIWTELGAVLARHDHASISKDARFEIREALERATGTKAP